MKTHEIAKAQNKALEQRLLQSIKKLPKFELKSTCGNDTAFNEPIVELTKKQTANFKNLLNEI
jgi:hypothetical protein